MIPDINTRNEHAGEEFVSTAVAAFTGAVVGSYLDNHTRFGRWVNNSPTADAIVAVIKIIAVIVAVGLFLLYGYFFLTA